MTTLVLDHFKHVVTVEEMNRMKVQLDLEGRHERELQSV